MKLSQLAFENAKRRGRESILFMTKDDGVDKEPLVLIDSGRRKDMLMRQLEYGSGVYSNGWGYTFVGLFDTREEWDEVAATLRVLNFDW
jgi:hypothetical protein